MEALSGVTVISFGATVTVTSLETARKFWLSSMETVILAVPAFLMVTVPSALTVATFSLSLVNLMPDSVSPTFATILKAGSPYVTS